MKEATKQTKNRKRKAREIFDVDCYPDAKRSRKVITCFVEFSRTNT